MYIFFLTSAQKILSTNHHDEVCSASPCCLQVVHQAQIPMILCEFSMLPLSNVVTHTLAMQWVPPYLQQVKSFPCQLSEYILFKKLYKKLVLLFQFFHAEI